ncbi:Hypothetical protein DHA2_152405 [Giardia duodenalis]|uniref:Uncharacterized protein n=1 Tax=Giardia intestinalis TaxID=5741 RepID=V6TBQ3_GIAIN|nr:Hypothetical protein DHA2_152405 [Giardia intestinalis]
MRLTLAIHKAFATQKAKREEIDFVIRPNSEEKTISVSLLVKQEVAAVCEVAAAYRNFGSSALVSDLANILRAVSAGNEFSIVAISTNSDRFGPLFPYTTNTIEPSMLGQIISTVRDELKQTKKAPVRYLITLSCLCIAQRGRVVDMLFPDNTELSLSRDEAGNVYYENLAEVACSSNDELAAILLAIQGEYTRVAEASRQSEVSPLNPPRDQSTKEAKVPALRLNIAVRQYKMTRKDDSESDRETETLTLDATSPSGGLQLSPPGEKIKPHEKPAKGHFWKEISTGNMSFYYITLQDVLGILSKTSRLSTYVLPEMNRPNSSAFFEISPEADSKLCLMAFDLMNDLLHRCSHAWRAAGVNIFRLNEAQSHRSGSTDLVSSRPRSRSSRSYFTMEDLDTCDDTTPQINVRRIERQTEAEKRCSEFKTQISKQAQGYQDQPVTRAPATSLQKGSISRHSDSEESADAFQLTSAQKPTILSKKQRRASSRTGKATVQSRGSMTGTRLSSITAASTPTQDSTVHRLNAGVPDTATNLSKFTHMLHLTSKLAEEEDKTQSKKGSGSAGKHTGQIPEQQKRSESRRTLSPTIVRPREQSAADARIERAHMTAKKSQSPHAGSIKTVSSMLEKTELLNLSRGSSVGSRSESKGKIRPMSHEHASPHSSKGAQMASPTRRASRASDRRASTQSPTRNRSELDILSQYRSMRIPADENGQFDMFSKMQLEIKRLARELEETRIAKVVTESGRNNLVAENTRLREEIASLVENQKYKTHTIKRLEKQLMEVRAKPAKIHNLVTQGVTQTPVSSLGDKKQHSYDDLLLEVESLQALNNELQAELAGHRNQLCKESTYPSEDVKELPPDTAMHELQILLQNCTTENKNLRLEVVALQEMLDVQRLLARISPRTTSGDDSSIKQQLDEVITINRQYEVQISELERAVAAADERLNLYEARQSREALLVETITQLRSQIHHMTKKLLAYEQQAGDGASPRAK